MRLLILLSMATALGAQVCNPGTYIGIAGVCTFCMPGTYSPLVGTTACQTCPTGTISPLGASGCTPCNAGYYAISTASCAFCMPGTFSYYAGSTACQTCPAGTGSPIGASSCVVCAAPCPNCMFPCRYVNGSLCPTCGSACTSCVAGTYNDGSTRRCVRCPAGTYSTLNQSVSSAACSACDAGKTTGPLDTGLTACVDCARINQTLPLNAVYYTPDDPLVCSWTCNIGYVSVNASVWPSGGSYTPSQAVQIAHVNADYCCSPTLAAVGTYLAGCTRASDGMARPCPGIANAHYFDSLTPKLDRCGDWACNDDFYSNGTGCVQQPRCLTGFTYRRDAQGALVPLPSGAYECTACSRCMDGSEPMAMCNSTADTRCRLCSPTQFSLNGSACGPVPPGFQAVIVRLTSTPAYQGRPAIWYDGTPLDWTQVRTGFFINTLTACQPIPDDSAYTADDAPCRRMDVNPNACAGPLCRSQCRPWNGTNGWYLFRQCVPCAYDPACQPDQFSDLSVCGGAQPPVCRPCPGPPPPNALRWINPGRWLASGPPCDFVCRDGYVQSNGSCIFCPNIPENAKPTVGCNWVCSLGFYNLTATKCVPCAGVPAACSVGAYLGYGPGDQCARCLPCANLVPNSIYTSQGAPNGPNTCGVRCMLGTFVDPAYGLDFYGNPVACRVCSQPQCRAGATFLAACSLYSDAQCNVCSNCPPGFRVSKPCTVGADTQCIPCADAPWNATFVQGCVWQCLPGFYTLGARCAKCSQPSDCNISDSFSYASPGCGLCTPCDPSLLLPGQCFNGDGQCGTTDRCGLTTGLPTTTTSQAATTTTSAAPPTTTPVPVFAALVVLTLPSNASLANLTTLIACPGGCTLKVLSIRRDNNQTVYCPACRRTLGDTMVVEVAVITLAPISLLVPDAAVTRSYPVNATLLADEYRLSVYLRGLETPYRPPPTPWATFNGAIVIVVIVACLVCYAKGGEATKIRRHPLSHVRIRPP